MSGHLPQVAALNQWCIEHSINICFLSIAQHSPTLINNGFLTLSKQTCELAKGIRHSLKKDEWHALVDIQKSPLDRSLHYRVVRYSEMLALRQQGKFPTGLSATVLPYSQASQSLLWQKRSATSHLFPGRLSLLGGGFNPNVDGDSGDDNDPRNTAQRECLEESALNFYLPEDTLVTITQEVDSGAIQINFLGVPASFKNAVADEEEGSLVERDIPLVAQISTLENFTALAKANLRAWLEFTAD